MTQPAFNRQIVKFSAMAKLTHAKYGTSRDEQLYARLRVLAPVPS